MLIAITGANGFLGSYLSNYLEKQNFNIRRIQRNNNNRNSFLIKEINENTDWSKALKDVEIIIHCAGKAHIFNNSKDAIKSIYSTNLEGTKKLAKEASKIGVKKFIFISTAKVFGEKTNADNKFSLDSPLIPTDHYSRSKIEAEFALREISSKSSMSLIIIRPPLIYGPGVKANFLKMMNYIYLGFPLPFGNIKNKRSIIFLGNLADFIRTCIKIKDLKKQIFLPTDHNPLSTPELIIKIGKSLKKKPNLIKIPKFLLFLLSLITLRKNMVEKLISSLNIDSTKSHNYIKWNPPFSTEEGLFQTADWFIKEKT